MSLLVLKHEKEILDMKQEIQSLQTLSQTMALQLVKYIEKDMSNKDSNKDNNNEDIIQEKEAVTISGPEFKCDLCSFKSEKLITLNKHINTKHESQKTHCVDAINEINTKKHSDDGKKTVSKAKFYCDECEFSATNKKTLKKHMVKDHHPEKNCENCTTAKTCQVCSEAE